MPAVAHPTHLPKALHNIWHPAGSQRRRLPGQRRKPRQRGYGLCRRGLLRGRRSRQLPRASNEGGMESEVQGEGLGSLDAGEILSAEG